MAELPIARGVFLCETIIVEEQSRNVTLVNCFTRRLADSFPTTHRFAVFAVFANGQGTIPVTVVVTDLTDDRRVYEQTVSVPFANPLQETRFLFRTGLVTFPHAGVYEVALETADGSLATTRVTLLPRGTT